MRIERGQLYPGAAIGRHPAKAPALMPERRDEEELADWREGRDAGRR